VVILDSLAHCGVAIGAGADIGTGLSDALTIARCCTIQAGYSKCKRRAAGARWSGAVPIIGDQGEFLALSRHVSAGATTISAFYGDIIKLRIGEGAAPTW